MGHNPKEDIMRKEALVALAAIDEAEAAANKAIPNRRPGSRLGVATSWH